VFWFEVFLVSHNQESLMRQQESERQCFVERHCLFCPERLAGTWHAYIAHMQEAHGFDIGPSENLVHVAEFVDQMEASMKRYGEEGVGMGFMFMFIYVCVRWLE
jgi:hypothetical protein